MAVQAFSIVKGLVQLDVLGRRRSGEIVDVHMSQAMQFHFSALLSVTLKGQVSVLLHSSDYVLYAIPAPDGRSLAIAEGVGTRNVWQIENF